MKIKENTGLIKMFVLYCNNDCKYRLTEMSARIIFIDIKEENYKNERTG